MKPSADTSPNLAMSSCKNEMGAPKTADFIKDFLGKRFFQTPCICILRNKKIGLVFGFCGCHFIDIGFVSVSHFPESGISSMYISKKYKQSWSDTKIRFKYLFSMSKSQPEPAGGSVLFCYDLLWSLRDFNTSVFGNDKLLGPKHGFYSWPILMKFSQAFSHGQQQI